MEGWSSCRYHAPAGLLSKHCSLFQEASTHRVFIPSAQIPYLVASREKGMNLMFKLPSDLVFGASLRKVHNHCATMHVILAGMRL